ncbi:hypothetical protein GCM10023074_57870 [Microbispora amethystogenes]
MPCSIPLTPRGPSVPTFDAAPHPVPSRSVWEFCEKVTLRHGRGPWAVAHARSVRVCEKVNEDRTTGAGERSCAISADSGEDTWEETRTWLPKDPERGTREAPHRSR